MQRIGFIVARNFQFMSFAAMSVFEFANLVTGESAYDIRVMSEHGGPIRSSMGVSIDTELLQNSGFDTLIVGGAWESERLARDCPLFCAARCCPCGAWHRCVPARWCWPMPASWTVAA